MKGLAIGEIATTISELSNAIFHVLDHILLLNRIKACEFKPTFIKKLDYVCNWLWASENTNCLIGDICDWVNLRQEMKQTRSDLLRIENQESEGILIN
jgi:hypothetical protein